eukprot:2134173-Rhodomonas_salina.1
MQTWGSGAERRRVWRGLRPARAMSGSRAHRIKYYKPKNVHKFTNKNPKNVHRIKYKKPKKVCKIANKKPKNVHRIKYKKPRSNTRTLIPRMFTIVNKTKPHVVSTGTWVLVFGFARH